MSAYDPKRTLMCIDPVGSSIDANSEIGNLQQPAVADPGSGKVSLGLTRRGGVAACLIQFRQTVVRPAVGWRAAERTLELSLRLSVAASLQQSGGKRLPDRVVPIRRLGIGQRVLQRGRPLKTHDGPGGVAFWLGRGC